MEDSLKKRYIIKLLASFINGVVGIVLIAIVPSALGPVAFGQFSYLQQFFAQILAFLDAGTSTAFFTKLSARRDRIELVRFYAIFSFILLLVLYAFVIGLNTLGLNVQVLPDIPTQYIYFGLLFGFFTWLTQIFIKISDAHALTVSVELIKIAHKLLTLMLLVWMVEYLVLDLSVYFYFHFISLFTFIFVVSLLFLKRSVFSKEVFLVSLSYKSLTKEFYHFASPLFVFNTVAIAAALFDIWLLQYISGSVETGYYGFAYAIAAMCFLFTAAMTPIISREFSKAFEEGNLSQMRSLFKRYAPMLYSLSAFFGVFIAFQSEILINIFADERFQGATVALLIMAFYPMHQTYGQLSASLFFAMENTKLYRNIGLLGTLAGLMLSFSLIYDLQLGAAGFAYKMVVMQLILVNVQLYFNAKALNLELGWFLMHQVVVIAFFVFIAGVSSLVQFGGSDLETLFIQAFVYASLALAGFIAVPYLGSMTRQEMKGFLFLLRKKIMRKSSL